MRLVAVIDIGTNSTRLLVAEAGGGQIRTVAADMATTRLGEGIGSGVLLEGAMDRTAGAVESFFHAARRLGAEKVVAVATSAVRDAANREAFLEMVKMRTGLHVKVLSGREEAFYSYRGALGGLAVDPYATAVMDVGGGSTELCWMEPQGLRMVSVNLGAVRLTLNGLPPEQVAAAFGPHLDRMRKVGITVLVGVGGTATTLAAVKQELAVYQPERVHGYCLSYRDVAGILKKLSAMDLAERRTVAGLQPERADIIVAGAGIVKAVMEGLGVGRLLVSECDLLHGLAGEEVERN